MSVGYPTCSRTYSALRVTSHICVLKKSTCSLLDLPSNVCVCSILSPLHVDHEWLGSSIYGAHGRPNNQTISSVE